MPRCMTKSLPKSRSASKYLARRRSENARRPSSRSTNLSGKGERKPARRISTRENRAPSNKGARPRLTVSTSGSSGTRGLLDHGEERRAILLHLRRADAVNLAKFVERLRLEMRHFDQRAVGKDHIGRLLGRARDRAAQRFQPVEKLGVLIARRRRQLACAPRLRLRRERIFAQRKRLLAAQNLAPGVGDNEAIVIGEVALDAAAPR